MNKKFPPAYILFILLWGSFFSGCAQQQAGTVFEKDGRLHTLIKLNKSDFIQPEGICFDKAENLYICNEGKDKQAIVYRFNRKSN